MSIIRIRHNQWNCWFTWDEPNASWNQVKDTLIREIQQTGFDHFTGEESIIPTHASNHHDNKISTKQIVKDKPIKKSNIKKDVANKPTDKFPDIKKEGMLDKVLKRNKSSRKEKKKHISEPTS